MFLLRNIVIGTVFFLLLFSGTSAQSPASAKDSIVYTEEFNNSNTGWTIINHGDSVYTTIENGHYVMNTSKASRFWALRFASYSPSLPRPNVIEVKFKLASDSPGGVCGLLWGVVKNEKNFFDESGFLISRNGMFGIFRVEQGKNFYLKQWTASSFLNTTGYNVLRIEQDRTVAFVTEEVSGIPYLFYINGQLVVEGIYPSANLGVMGFYCDPHSILSVDYVKFAIRK